MGEWAQAKAGNEVIRHHTFTQDLGGKPGGEVGEEAWASMGKGGVSNTGRKIRRAQALMG